MLLHHVTVLNVMELRHPPLACHCAGEPCWLNGANLFDTPSVAVPMQQHQISCYASCFPSPLSTPGRKSRVAVRSLSLSLTHYYHHPSSPPPFPLSHSLPRLLSRRDLLPKPERGRHQKREAISLSLHNMATIVTCTRFTDEYQLYEELGKWVTMLVVLLKGLFPFPRRFISHCASVAERWQCRVGFACQKAK